MVIDYVKRMSVVFCALAVISIAFAVPAYARTATSSDAVRDTDYDIADSEALDGSGNTDMDDVLPDGSMDDVKVAENAADYEYLDDDEVLRYILS